MIAHRTSLSKASRGKRIQNAKTLPIRGTWTLQPGDMDTREGTRASTNPSLGATVDRGWIHPSGPAVGTIYLGWDALLVMNFLWSAARRLHQWCHSLILPNWWTTYKRSKSSRSGTIPRYRRTKHVYLGTLRYGYSTWPWSCFCPGSDTLHQARLNFLVIPRKRA